jgi:hypothetical protein
MKKGRRPKPAGIVTRHQRDLEILSPVRHSTPPANELTSYQAPTPDGVAEAPVSTKSLAELIAETDLLRPAYHVVIDKIDHELDLLSRRKEKR